MPRYVAEGAIVRFRDTSQMKRPAYKYRKEAMESLDKALKCRDYATGPDALALLDLTPTALGIEPDRIRVWMSRNVLRAGQQSSAMSMGGGLSAAEGALWPENQLLHDGRIEVERTPKSRRAGGTRQRPLRYIMPRADFFSRLLISVGMGLFLIVPCRSCCFCRQSGQGL
jgi:hypothetical protein